MTSPQRWPAAVASRAPSDPARVVSERAAVLRDLHRPGDPVILPNVWDAASARAAEAAGFPAIATSSAAIAESLGYADGEATPVNEMLDAVRRIVRAVPVPVTADLERGYRMPPTEFVERLVATGAAGCNIEDSDPRTGELIDPDRQADLLRAIRQAAMDAGVDLVINARIDTFLNGDGTPRQRLAGALDRGRRYFAAGADCVYPILATDPHDIRTLVERLDGPVNVLCRDGVPGLSDLAKLGVARISFGPDLHRAARSCTVGMLAAIQAGRYP